MSETVRVCWLSGSYHLRRNALRSIKDSVGEHELHIYHDDISGEYLSHQLLQSDLFGAKKIIILKNLPSFEGSDINKSQSKSIKQMKELFDLIPEDTLLVIDGVSHKKPKSYSVLNKYVKKIGKTIEFPQYLKKNQASSWIESKLSEHKKECETEYVNMILEVVGEEYGQGIDIDKLYVFMDKILNYIGRKKRITETDISQVAGTNTNFIIWNLFKEFDKRNYKKSLELFERVRMVSKDDITAINQIIHMTRWRYRLMLFLKESLSKGSDESKILEDLSNLRKLSRKENTSGLYSIFEYDGSKVFYSDKVAQNMLTGPYGQKSVIKIYSVQHIREILCCIYEVSLKIRQGCTDVDSVLLIDNLFMTICGLFNVKNLKSLRRLSYVK